MLAANPSIALSYCKVNLPPYLHGNLFERSQYATGTDTREQGCFSYVLTSRHVQIVIRWILSVAGRQRCIEGMNGSGLGRSIKGANSIYLLQPPFRKGGNCHLGHCLSKSFGMQAGSMATSSIVRIHGPWHISTIKMNLT